MNVDIRNKPGVDFIGIGVSKCGTTWVYQCLKEHPETCCSHDKETRFFSRNYALGFKWYAEQFSHCHQGKVRGEFSPDYIDSEETIDRMIAAYPNAKFIVSLRRPIDQIKSRWQFGYKRGARSHLHLEVYVSKWFDQVTKKVSYGSNLSYLVNQIDRSQLHVMLFEEWSKNPNKEIIKLYDFLGIQNDFTPTFLKEKINDTQKTRTKYLWFNQSVFLLRRTMKSNVLCRKITTIAKVVGVTNFISYLLKMNRTDVDMKLKFDPSLTRKTKNELQNLIVDEMNILEQNLHITVPTNWREID